MKLVQPVLKIEQIAKTFGGLAAVSDFNLTLKTGEIIGVIGPNGAGKTTVFNLITGVYASDSGRIIVGEREITGLAPDRISLAGVARTFQNIRLFGEMTVWDNIKIAFNSRTGYNLWDLCRRTGNFKKQEQRIGRESLDFLARFDLADRRQELAKNLSYGEQRRLEIARALATNPQILLLDEPAAGMNPKEVGDLIALIHQIHQDFQLAILLIEHQMPVVMELCDFVHVMDFGRTIASGKPEEVINDLRVIRAYLGEEEEA
jgi:branched-chain amino acid transport system ATP-binding protein